jgi:Protein of unknown function (DUF3253)
MAMSTEPVDDDLVRETLFALLQLRTAASTICPSEVARALAHEDGDWRSLMPHVRRVAAGLASQGLIRVTSHGEPIDALAAHGPIRIGRPDGASSS